MKKLFFTLVALVGFSAIGFSQEQAIVANSLGKTELVNSKASGEYNFIMPANVTDETVAKSSTYYTEYFTVAYDNTSKNVKITMLDDVPQSRIIIPRFLVSCGVEKIEVDGENLDIYTFSETYLK